MMRFGWIIVALAAISAAAVRLCLEQAHARSEMYSLEARRLTVRRNLWDQQLRLGELTAPQHIRVLSEDWPFRVMGPGEYSPEMQPARGPVGERTAPGSPANRWPGDTEGGLSEDE
jgi:hypothetical protein